jgi:hypothetical protein
MCERPVLTNSDPKKTFYLQTDTSTSGAGAVLSQEADGTKKRRPIAYFSCTYSPAEANYNIYEKEFLAVIKAIQNWRAHHLDRKTIHNRDGPQELDILEGTQETLRVHSVMAREVARLQL